MADDLVKLTTDQLKKIQDNGFCYMEIKPGYTVKVTLDDLVFKKEELDAFLEKQKKEN